MNTIEVFKKIWANMEYILDVMRIRINERTLIQGPGIDLKEQPNGVVISLAKLAKDDPASVNTGGWLTIDIMDASCHRSTIQVWFRPPPAS